MKILLLGAGGQLAFDLKSSLASHELVAMTRQELDIEKPSQVQRALTEVMPDVVINTAAYNLVDHAEDEPHVAFATNALGPRNLAMVCGGMNRTLLHFSTDYVFGLDAQRQTPWTVTDAPGPVSVYGSSKLAGEYAVRAYCEKHFVVRTCGLYGTKGSRGKGGNFVETMLKLAGRGGPLTVVNDQHCTPSYTHDIALATAQLIESQAYGLYHMTNAGSCTWYELAKEIFAQQKLTVDCQPITSAQFGAQASRPPYSVLDCSKLEAAGVSKLPAWQEALATYLGQRS